MQNVFLFTGTNSFALRQERRRWIAEFIAKHGSENALAIDGSQFSLRQLLDEVTAIPFIAAKRLVTVQGLPKFTKEEMQILLSALHPDCVLLFCDPAPDKRLGGSKHLLSVATVKEFPAVTGRPLLQWVSVCSQQQGTAMESAAADLLLQIVGEDQDMLVQEIAKLSLRAPGAITPARVAELAVPSGEQEIWQLTTVLSRGDLPAALRYARSLLNSGEDAFSLWNILLWLLRSLTAVTLSVSEGERNPAKVASLTGVAFPTAKMLLQIAQSVSPPKLRRLVDWAVDSDRDLKTGGYRATGESQQELTALIDAFIVLCCHLQQEAFAPSSRSA